MTSPTTSSTGERAIYQSARKSRVNRRQLAIVLAAACLTLLLALARNLWLPSVGRFLIAADPLHRADAVVALSGGERDRAAAAASLVKNGQAEWFVATTMPFELPGVRRTYGELIAQEAMWRGVSEDRILIADQVAETTYQEALAMRVLAREQGWDSLIVVTDPYHTRRARMCFRRAFRETGVAVIVRPVEVSWYRADAWWRDREGLRVTWTEYLKLVLYVVGFR